MTEHGKHIIRVSLVGAEIPKDSIAVAQARLPQYGLGGAILEVRQGYGQNQADISTLSSVMFKDIYLHNQEQIARQQKTIDSLENLASHYQQYDFQPYRYGGERHNNSCCGASFQSLFFVGAKKIQGVVTGSFRDKESTTCH